MTSPVTISPLRVAGGQPGPDHRRGVDPGDGADRHRHAVPLIDDNGRNILDRPRLAHAPDVARFPLVDEVTTADVGVVVPKGIENVGHGQAIAYPVCPGSTST